MANNAANVQKFIEKMEQLDKMIANQGSGIISNTMIDEAYKAGLSLAENPASSSDNKFSMLLDSWGTSIRRVGP